MNNDIKKEDEIKKIIPSKLEKAFQHIIYKTLGKNIPINMTPNQITLIGALCGLFGIICAFLGSINTLFLIGTIFGLIGHLICDDLDGYIARTRNMSSKAGGFFDLLIDIMFITYLLIGLAFANLVSFQSAILLVPVYALLMFTSMNYILHFKEFIFPRLGPIETHILLIIMCIGIIVFGNATIFVALNFKFKFGDIVLFIGGLPMYYEMIRLQVQLFRRLKKLEQK